MKKYFAILLIVFLILDVEYLQAQGSRRGNYSRSGKYSKKSSSRGKSKSSRGGGRSSRGKAKSSRGRSSRGSTRSSSFRGRSRSVSIGRGGGRNPRSVRSYSRFRQGNLGNYMSIGGYIAPTSYIGDIATQSGGFLAFDLNSTRFAVGLSGAKKLFSNGIARFDVGYVTIGGKDYNPAFKNTDNSSNRGRFLRNLHFRNNIVEASAIFQYNILSGINGRRAPVSPYILLGGLALYSNPKAKLPDDLINADQTLVHESVRSQQWVPLNNFATETNKPTSPFVFGILGGIGVNIGVVRNMDIFAEVNIRAPFSDYIDDISGGEYAKPNGQDGTAIGEGSIYQNLGDLSYIAYRLSYRSAEPTYVVTGADRDLENPVPGQIYPGSDGLNFRRGSANSNDYYATLSVGVRYILKSRGRVIGRGRVSRGRRSGGRRGSGRYSARFR